MVSTTIALGLDFTRPRVDEGEKRRTAKMI
jgi:hypothetical protein